MRKLLRSFWFWLALLLLGGAGGYLYYDANLAAAQTPTSPTVQTSTVRRGEIVVSATGAGAVVADAAVNLAFRSGGLLLELPVQVGDSVQAGDLLARLDDTDAQAAVAQAEIALRQAEISLAKLMADPDAAALASARTSLLAAQADLARIQTPPTAAEMAAARDTLLSAQQALNALLAGPTADTVAAAQADLRSAEIAVQQAQAEYDKVAWRTDVARTPQAAALEQATLAYEKAKASYEAKVAGASADQVSATRAKVAQAQNTLDTLQKGASAADLAAAEAKVAQAQANLDALLAGADALNREAAELAIQQAQNNLAAARRQLANTQILAPFAGVVTGVNGAANENVGANTLIVLATRSQPLIEVFLDETDLDKVGVDFEVEATFDAFPNDLFHGRIEQVDPSLTTRNGVTTVRALARLQDYAKPQPLPLGLNATVDVIGGRATNALLVPVEALREITPGQFAVFIMEEGEPRLRMVEVGLMDFTFAEIRSGLSQGDVVTTGVIETR